jgi:hypothetical protein
LRRRAKWIAKLMVAALKFQLRKRVRGVRVAEPEASREVDKTEEGGVAES